MRSIPQFATTRLVHSSTAPRDKMGGEPTPSWRRIAVSLDMYRKVPGDLLEGSKQGKIISWIALVVLFTLFFLETKSYWTSKIVTDLSLDFRRGSNPNLSDADRIRVMFNFTMMDLKCEYVTINVVSLWGKEQNVTKNINKWPVDAKGVQQRLLAQKHKDHETIELHDTKITTSIEDLHLNGEHAIPLDPTTLEYALHSQDFVFVDFFASWCSHCLTLAPTWEALAEVMQDAATSSLDRHVQENQLDYNKAEYEEALKLHLPVLIGKIDCVKHHVFCMQQGIFAYPTLRLFVHGEIKGDYMGHRTILNFVQFLRMAEENDEFSTKGKHLAIAEQVAHGRYNLSEEERQWARALEHSRHQEAWNPQDHPGCQIAGMLLLNRVPGNFYIQAQSASHDLVPHMTNVSHHIHHLSFRRSRADEAHQKIFNFVPPNFNPVPLDNKAYITNELHQAYHHYIKLIPTNLFNYQMVAYTQLALYPPTLVPEAKFLVDLSPIATNFRWWHRPWYDYITSVMAIVGGTFTVVGMLATKATYTALPSTKPA
jgi:thiol-disulfide isomerase/thioredoxin